MKNIKKLIFVGFGPATIGGLLALSRILKKDDPVSILVIEKSENLSKSSLSGLRSDGKIFVSEEIGGSIQIPLSLQNDILNFYLSFINKHDLEEITSKHKNYEKIFNEESKNFHKFGFKLAKADYYHIGTDLLPQLLTSIFDNFTKIFTDLNIPFSTIFSCEQVDIDFLLKLVIFSNILLKNKKSIEHFDRLFIGVGRSGYKFLETFKKNNPEYANKENIPIVDFGVRIEYPAFITEELDKKFYEFKVFYKTDYNQIIRSFCNNPNGFIVTEEYENKMTTVNGHSFKEKKSENSNFAILCSHKFTEPFNQPNTYLEKIVELANTLSGKNKVILQTFKDFKNNKRTKKLWRTKPTLNSDSYILGDLNYIFPRKTAESIIEFINNLGKIIPGIDADDNLIYGIEAKFYNEILNSKLLKKDNIYLIGDCSGKTRSIMYATCHGYTEVLNVIEEGIYE